LSAVWHLNFNGNHLKSYVTKITVVVRLTHLVHGFQPVFEAD